MTRPLVVADLFCGAGGTSEDLALAAKRAARKLDLVAINHWDVALETHAANIRRRTTRAPTSGASIRAGS
jgi:DNA (cytosine-5)-methyltransferase 1